MITRETDYAIRAMIYLAVQPDYTVPVSSADIADEMGIPYRFLRKIVLKLIAAKLVTSRRGKGGGLNIAVDPETTSLFDMMYAIDPNTVTINLCLEDASQCNRAYFCGLRQAFMQIQNDFHHSLKNTTLASLAKADGARLDTGDKS